MTAKRTTAPNPTTRPVNDLLSTLRGEQYRHSQNLLNHNRTRLPPSSYTHNSPVLPEAYADEVPSSHLPGSSRSVPTGPAAPKSWTSVSESEKVARDTRAWRTESLTPVLTHLEWKPPITPPLAILCLEKLLRSYEEDVFIEHVLPHVQAYLRRDLIRWMSVGADPLSSSLLYVICEPERHAAGELIIVGPQATLRSDYFRRSTVTATAHDTEWDEEDWGSAVPAPVETFVLLDARITPPTLLTLPPTLTTLALIHVSPISVHRLPSVCPLLAFIDLSYNDWFTPSDKDDRIVWAKWARLGVIVMRGCVASGDLRKKINSKGRWADVDIVV